MCASISVPAFVKVCGPISAYLYSAQAQVQLGCQFRNVCAMGVRHLFLVAACLGSLVLGTLAAPTTSFGGNVTCTFVSDGLKSSPMVTPCALASFGGRESASDLDVVVPRGSRALRYGCELPAGAAKGRAVLVNRGKCPFTVKAEQAAKAGAAMLLIINDDNTTPVVGGRPSQQIDFPVLMLPSSQGRKLRLASVRFGATGNVDFLQPPSLAAWRLTRTLQPRRCSGLERVVVLHVRSGRDDGPAIVSYDPDLPVASVGSVHDAILYLRTKTLAPDVVVFIDDSALAGVAAGADHLVVVPAIQLLQQFCGARAAIVLPPASQCAGCSNSTTPDVSRFVAYGNVAAAFLAGRESGVDMGDLLSQWSNATVVDAFGDVWAVAENSGAVVSASGEAVVQVQGGAVASANGGFVHRNSGTAPPIVLSAPRHLPTPATASVYATIAAVTAWPDPMASPGVSSPEDFCPACYSRRSLRVARQHIADRSPPSSSPLFQPASLINVADVVVDGVNNSVTTHNLERVKAGANVFVPYHLVPMFFEELASAIHQPYVLLTGAASSTHGHGVGSLSKVASEPWVTRAVGDPHLMAWWVMALPNRIKKLFPKDVSAELGNFGL